MFKHSEGSNTDFFTRIAILLIAVMILFITFVNTYSKLDILIQSKEQQDLAASFQLTGTIENIYKTYTARSTGVLPPTNDLSYEIQINGGVYKLPADMVFHLSKGQTVTIEGMYGEIKSLETQTITDLK